MSFVSQIFKKFFSKKTAFNLYLYQILGFYPENLVFYTQAFKHKSLHKDNNERLEFLGDSILDTIISKELFARFPHKNEGELSKLRSKIVNRASLNKIGHKLQLDKHLQFQLNSTHIENTNINGNTFEALMGAIYLDGGIDLAQKFLSKQIFDKHIKWNEVDKKILDYKSKLIQHAQKDNLLLEYVLVGEEKNDAHITEFEIVVLFEEKELARAKGTSKKKAEQLASKIAFEKL